MTRADQVRAQALLDSKSDPPLSQDQADHAAAILSAARPAAAA